MHSLGDILWRVPLLDQFGNSTAVRTANPARHRTFRVAMLLVAVAFLNAIDLVCTLFARSVGMLDELNPLAAFFLARTSTPGLIVFKLLGLTIGGAILWRLRRASWTQGGCWILFAAYCGLGLLWFLWLRDSLYVLEFRVNTCGILSGF